MISADSCTAIAKSLETQEITTGICALHAILPAVFPEADRLKTAAFSPVNRNGSRALSATACNNTIQRQKNSGVSRKGKSPLFLT
ncbi:hypothetical protein [uncultured Victivallis sp.]|uniref:hypothetical protein n=1 Tax=Victivallis sp. TaxID=2049020 RepID=UPI0025FDF6E8|nr:hypothetical protein [uncultured Victivallis sp.]